MTIRFDEYLRGVSWQLVERAFVGIINVVVGVVAARHFGAAVLGEIAWAASLVGLFAVAASAGLDLAIVRRLATCGADVAEVMATAVVVRLLAALAAGLLVVIALGWIQSPSSFAVLAVCLILPTLTLPAIQSPTLLLHANEQFARLARLRLLAALPVAAIRMGLLLGNVGPVAWIMYLTVEAVAAAALISGYVLRSTARTWPLRASGREARSLMRVGWPELLTGLAATVYLRIDQIMLAPHVANEELGQYAVAARLVETIYVVPVIATGALAPMLFKLHQNDPIAYQRLRRDAHAVSLGLSLVGATALAVVARPVCDVLYGSEFERSGAYLQTLAWTLVFVSLSVTTGKSVHAEGLVQAAAKRALAGAGLNVVLNAALIPRMGAHGAALASLASYWVASHLAYFLDRRTWHLGVVVSGSPLYLVRFLRRRYGGPPSGGSTS